MVRVILVEPQIPGNIGAVARVMKNFGVRKLWLVNPQCDHRAPEARARAMHALDLLRKARVFSSLEAVRKKCSCLVATTSKIGSDYNILRSPLAPEDGMALVQRRKNVGLVFGRENDGLVNKEIAVCDFVVSIPAAHDYPALNMSHAVAILLYIFFRTKKAEHHASHITFAGRKEKDVLMRLIDEKVRALPFGAESKRRTQQMAWRRLIGKSFLTRREIYALFGFFKKGR